MKSFSVWITLLLPSYQSTIAAVILNKGYAVSALTKKEMVYQTPNCISAIMALEIGADDKEISAGAVRDMITKELDNTMVKYHSVIVHGEDGTAAWTGSNITLPEDQDSGSPYRTVH